MLKLYTKTIQSVVTPARLFQQFRSEAHPFFLDSGMDADKLGQYSFLGHTPFLTLSIEQGTVRLETEQRTDLYNANGFEVLHTLLKQHQRQACSSYPFVGGAVGFFGYEMGRLTENLPGSVENDVDFEDGFFGFYNHVYAYEHTTKQWQLFSWADTEASHALADMEETLSKARTDFKRKPYHVGKLKADMDKTHYTACIHTIRDYIRKGDIYQANFTQRFQADFNGDPLDLYYQLSSINPAPFAAFFKTNKGAILSSSPERLLRKQGTMLESRPIKGTRQRGALPAEDKVLAEELLNSEKDRAELLMIVDLVRNDLGRVAAAGTVKVPELFHLESYPTVHHLVATVTAELAKEKSVMDAVQALFPGGSITGAPKIRAMEIIDELERTERKVYTGSIGYISFNDNADFNIAIRTLLVTEKTVSFQVGGGIVWDSQAEEEYEESLNKGKALAKALGANIGNLS